MKPAAECGYTNMYLTCLPLRMFWNKKMLFRHCFSTLL